MVMIKQDTQTSIATSYTTCLLVISFDCCVALDDIQITFQSFHFQFFKHQRCQPNKICLVICSRAAVSQSNHIINMFQEEMKKKMSSVLCCTVSKGQLALLMLTANKNYARSFLGVFLWQSLPAMICPKMSLITPIFKH